MDITISFDLRGSAKFSIVLCAGKSGNGITIDFDKADSMLICLEQEAPIFPVDNHLELRILIDRASVEIFHGPVSMSNCFITAPDNHDFFIIPSEGNLFVNSLTIHKLKSAWK